MNVPAKVEKPMLLEFMADKYGLRPQEFADTVRKTCGLPQATPEEFAAFVMVARQYDLNPILREIHAFPRKGGGIVPVVSVDGWVNLINRQPQCDGFDFQVEHSDSGELISMTCSMYRKDRSHPTVVTEYLSECIRPTEPWKMQHRMLRHKTLIQTGRYAFGFSGIYDEDEAERIAAAVDITPPEPPVRSKPPARSLPRITAPAEAAPATPEKQVAATPPTPPVKEPVATARHEPQTTGNAPAERVTKPIYDPTTGEVNDAAEPTPAELLTSLTDMLETAATEEEIEEIWDGHDVEARLESVEKGDRFLTLAMGIKQKHLTRISG